MIKNGQYGKFCVVTQLDSTKTIHVSAVALLDTDVCLAVEGCLCGVVVGLALVDADVCLAAEAWLFGVRLQWWLCWILMFVWQQGLGCLAR